MIPKDSTPIKNKILIDILAKGLLSKDEMRIIFYIIRWSWGFDGERRRQDWTKELKKRKIADDIEMDEGQFNKIMNKMVLENKIIVKNKCYQFNEHYDKWKLDKSSSFGKLDKLSSKTCEIVKLNLINYQTKLDKSSSLGIPNNKGKGIKNKDLRGGEHLSKETLKETKRKLKKTLSQASFSKDAVVYQLTIYFEGKIIENNRAINKKNDAQIQSWCKDMDKLIRIDRAKPNEIKKIIDWVVEDKFWAKNILCPASLRKHYPRFYKEVIDRGKSLEEKIETDHRLDDVD